MMLYCMSSVKIILTFVVLTWMWGEIGESASVPVCCSGFTVVWCSLTQTSSCVRNPEVASYRSSVLASVYIHDPTEYFHSQIRAYSTSLPTLTLPCAASLSNSKQGSKVTYLHLLVCYLQARLIMKPRRCIRVTPG